jgi:hypothetical protein
MSSTLSRFAQPLLAAGRKRWLRLALALGVGAAALSGCYYYDPYYDGPYYDGPYYGPPAYVAPSIYIGPGYYHRHGRRHWRGRRWR